MMTHRYIRLLVAGTSLFGLVGMAPAGYAKAKGGAPEETTVVAAKVRADSLEKAAAVLKRTPPPSLAILESMPNPFVRRAEQAPDSSALASPSAPAPAASRQASAPPRALTDAELLSRLSAAVNPSGSFVLGGKPLLLFGERKVFAGQSMTIKYEGRDYVLKVTEITSSSFTLAYNRETLTRSIK